MWSNVSLSFFLTMITSIGTGTGNLALYRSFSSFTANTTSMIIMDITRSQMLVEVIWTKTISSVCASKQICKCVKKTIIWYQLIYLYFRSVIYLAHISSNTSHPLKCSPAQH